jgi:hypothetical protein
MMGDAIFHAHDIDAAFDKPLELKMMKGDKHNKEAMFKLAIAGNIIYITLRDSYIRRR